ncbi:alpha/beta hydrolase [Pedobacter sp. MC2016-15]|uniref:alpha/beta hydrolase n=1 Tax=Pedobacter sp. MC2016-15 TaxID=2994473 RepID=UPI00224725EF|nr:alpha/beta hydrolase [Pedobacter sp. MC2016-15]MCX2479619.1 alpha/beta hydrolase [Pedobacter sp. MC2016-15]
METQKSNSKLDPQVEALLNQFKSAAAQDNAELNYSSTEEEITALRQNMADLIPLGGLPETVLNITNLNIPGPGGPLPIRIYKPVDKTVLPVLVYFHGGGFIAGNLDSSDTFLRALCNRADCLIVSVDYRLAPEHPFPAATEDAYAALLWISKHADVLDADARKIAVGGDSAGGMLAALMAQQAARDGLKLSLQVLLYPNLDATNSSDSWKELGSGEYLVSLQEMNRWYDHYIPSTFSRENPKISPLFARDLAGLAPALIITAELDPLRDEGTEYAARLRKSDNKVSEKQFPGMIHGFASLAGVLDAGKKLIDDVGASLESSFL